MGNITYKDCMAVFHDLIPRDVCAKAYAAFDKYSQSDICFPGVSGGDKVQLDTKKSMDIWLGLDLSRFPELAAARSAIMPYIHKALGDYLVKYPGLFWNYFGSKGHGSLIDTPPEFYLDNYSKVFTVQPCQLQKYDANDGGYPAWHCEYSAHNGCEKRILTYMFYLNDVYEGGETQFLNQEIAVTPRAGTLCIFPAWSTHYHKGNKPISNDKMIGTSWIVLRG